MGLLWLTLLVIATLRGAASISSESQIWRTYAKSEDVEDLCNGYSKHYNRECNDQITEEHEQQLLQLIAARDSYRTVCYITENILKIDDSYIMDQSTCSNFWDRIEAAKPKDMYDIIEDQVSSMGYTFEFQRTKSTRLLAKKVDQIIEVRRCHIKLIAMPFGNVRNRWHHVSSLIPEPTKQFVRTSISTINSGIRDLWNRQFGSTTGSSEDSELDRAYHMDETTKSSIRFINKHEKDCYLNDDQSACAKLTRLMDEFILDNLGIWYLRRVKEYPNLREITYSWAKFSSSTTQVWFLDQLDRTWTNVLLAGKYSAMILTVMLLIFIGYRSEFRTFASMTLASSGLSLIPTLSLIRMITTSLISRFSGLLITLAVLFTTVGLQNNFLSASSAIAVIYGTLVLYANAIRVSTSQWIPIASFIPLLGYSMYRSVDISKLPNFTVKSSVPFMSAPSNTLEYIRDQTCYTTPSILVCFAIAISVSLYALANYCNNIGHKRYRSLGSAETVPTGLSSEIPFSEFVRNFYHPYSSTLLVLVIIPGMFYLDTWALLSTLILSTMAISASGYYYIFHESYITEGEASHDSDGRTIEVADILRGSAPRSVLPRFKRCMRIGLICIAVSAGLRQDIYAGVAIGGLVSVALLKDSFETHKYLHYFSSLVLMTSGSLSHAFMGFLYLMGGLWDFNNISHGLMESCETERAANNDPH